MARNKKYKRHVKWYHIEPKVASLARKIIPASWFIGIDGVILADYSSQAPALNLFLSYYTNDGDILAISLPKTGKIFLFRDKIKEYLEKEYGADYYKDKETRRIVELGLLAHEFYHNKQRLERRFYYGLYHVNPVYREKIEREADRMARKILERFK